MEREPRTPAVQPSVYQFSQDEKKHLSAYLAAGVLPPVLEEAIEGYVAKKTGKDLDDPIVLDRLRRAIVSQKDAFWKPAAKRRLLYTKGYSVLGYLAYHFPVYFMQTGHLLAMLACDGLIKKKMTILDIGTGPGVVPFAIAHVWSCLHGVSADVFSVEHAEEQIEAFLYLREAFVPKGGKVSVKPPVLADITGFDPPKIPRSFDLIIFSNVLNEVYSGDTEKRADLVLMYADHLAPDGSILITEPAEEVTSTQLRVLSLALKKRGLTLHSPCSFLHGTNCTPDRCWSFVEQPCIRPTRLMQKLADSREPYRYLNTDIKYSYVVIRKDKKTRGRYRVPPGVHVLRLAQVHRHVEQRVSLVAAKMSENLGDEKFRVFRICDGSAAKPVYAVLPAYHITPENRALFAAPYGTILELNDVLVRYNARHDAYNVLVNRSSHVHPAG